MRIALPVLVVSVSLVAACSEGNAPARGGFAGAYAPVVPVAMLFTPDNDESEAAVFEDDDLNIDVIQVYAYEGSYGSAVFLQFPAAMASSAGSYVLDPNADPAVRGWFATSDSHDEDDLTWQFALHSATLVVVTPATTEGATIAVGVSSGAFVFENEDGLQNPAVTALIGGVSPAITAELDDDAIVGCGDLD